MVQFLIVDDGSSLESKISPPPPRLSIEFVIVGGAIAGITAAVSLARAGHKVTLLDNDPNLFKVRTRPSCSPNININISHVQYIRAPWAEDVEWLQTRRDCSIGGGWRRPSAQPPSSLQVCSSQDVRLVPFSVSALHDKHVSISLVQVLTA